MKPIEDIGHLAQATKPFKPRYYDDEKLPDPVQCAGSIIGVRNRNDHNRLGLRVSDGSSWLPLQVGAAAAPVVQQDITPLVRAAVESMLPALVPQPVKVIDHAQQSQITNGAELSQLRNDLRVLAQANLDITEHLNPIADKIDDLEAQIQALREHVRAIDSTPITEIKAA